MCKNGYGSSNIHDSMISAGLDAVEVDACQGDSGMEDPWFASLVASGSLREQLAGGMDALQWVNMASMPKYATLKSGLRTR